jgi:hypothetical protein
MAKDKDTQAKEVEFDPSGWFDPSVADIEDSYEALDALRASRTPSLIEVEILQGRGDNENPEWVQGVGVKPGVPDLSDEQIAASKAYRRLERSLFDKIAAEHLREQREAVGLLTPPPA